MNRLSISYVQPEFPILDKSTRPCYKPVSFPVYSRNNHQSIFLHSINPVTADQPIQDVIDSDTREVVSE